MSLKTYHSHNIYYRNVYPPCLLRCVVSVHHVYCDSGTLQDLLGKGRNSCNHAWTKQYIRCKTAVVLYVTALLDGIRHIN